MAGVHKMMPKSFPCLLFTAYCLLLEAYPPGWSDDILLTPEDNKVRFYPDVDVDGFNNVWVVWDSGSWVNNTAEVLFSKRDSVGGVLIHETEVSTNVPYSYYPRIAVDGSNNIHIIWREISPLGMGLGYAKLANDGSIIVPSHLVVSGAGGGESSMRPEMVMNKYKEVCIVWDEQPAGYNQMDWTKLDSMGNPVITKLKVSLDTFYAYWPGIGVDSFANSHLGYRLDIPADQLVYTKLDKDGNILINNMLLDQSGSLPTIIADRSQNIHMVYPHHTPSGWVINYLKLDQNANILVGPKTLYEFEYCGIPHMAMDSLQYLHIVWEDQTASGTFPIYYTKIDTLGNFAIPPMQVVYPPYTPGGGLPRIAVDRNNHLHLIWVDNRIDPNTADIFYKRGENEETIKELARLKAQNQPKISVFPNPFTTETKIAFSLSQEIEKGKIEIFDILGRKVKEFSHLTNCQLSITWQGDDNVGNRLPSGIYFICLSVSKSNQSVPVVLLR